MKWVSFYFAGFYRNKCIQESKAFVHFRPSTDFSSGSTEFQIHKHAQCIRIQIRNSVNTIFTIRENAIQFRIDGSHVGNGCIVYIHFRRSFMHAFTCGNFLEAGFSKVFDNRNNVLVGLGCKKIIVRDRGFGVIKFMFGG